MSSASEVSELRITLLDVEPQVWRLIAVPTDLTLADLHIVLQAVMGWENRHLHQFETADGIRYETHDLERNPDGARPICAASRPVRAGLTSPRSRASMLCD